MTHLELIKIIMWATGDDTGLSSKSICRYMLNINPTEKIYLYPGDEYDRGRCVRLLQIMPKWIKRLDEMKRFGDKLEIKYLTPSLHLRSSK